jgi:F-type H+-transporting ATPase subunit c
MHELATAISHFADVAAQTTTNSGGITGNVKQLAAGLSMGLGAIGPGIGIGILVNGAAQAIGRNPEASGRINGALFIGIGLAEAVAIYALVIAILILFAS